ncbi:DNA polymerase nu-like [Chrysoperla carnea]|uniref:DNA polymerase nu-like n=1 Tax=Chrysoperla carnea TaxID=189513 RepID=UPI001D079661|nr:DNA polymerase nu-like [Chrysoperla carnea]
MIVDIQIGYWLLDSNNIVKCFNDILNYLNVQPFFDIKSNDTIQRGCYYLMLLSQVYEKLTSMLIMYDLWTLFINLEMRLVPILAAMRYRGIRVDRNSLEHIKTQLDDEIKKIELKAYTICGKVFHINSAIELRTILYDELKLDQLNGVNIKRTDIKGAKSTSESMLKMLRKFHPLPNVIMEYRKLNKIQTGYVESLIQWIQDDVIHTTWDQSSAATDKTINLRNLFIARENYKFIVIDFQQIEFRLFAHLSKDRNLIEIFQNNTDIFVTLIEQLQNEINIVDIDRDTVKRILYAIMYGAGPIKLSQELEIDVEKANKIYSFIIGKFSVLKSFPKDVIEECRSLGYLRSLTGRRRYFPNISNSNFQLQLQSERQAVNFVIQGSAADICKLVMIRIENILAAKNYDCHLLLQIHDELLWEIHDTCFQEATSA